LPALAEAGVTGIHRSACSEALCGLDTGDKPRYDNAEGQTFQTNRTIRGEETHGRRR